MTKYSKLFTCKYYYTDNNKRSGIINNGKSKYSICIIALEV